GDHHILTAIRAKVSNGDRFRRGVQFGAPELRAGAGIEGAEAGIESRADEDEPAGGGDRPAEIRSAPVLLAPPLQLSVAAEGDAPGDVASGGIDGREFAPGRLLAGVGLRVDPSSVAVDRLVGNSSAVIRRPHFAGTAQIARVDEDVAELGVEGDAAPI